MSQLTNARALWTHYTHHEFIFLLITHETQSAHILNEVRDNVNRVRCAACTMETARYLSNVPFFLN